MVLNNTAAAFIGASVTLVLVIIFMILMVVLVRQCLAFMAKRSAIRQHVEAHRQAQAELDRQRRTSITEPVNPTFDWHHSIRIAGTPPPTYHEAKKLPPYDPNLDVTIGKKLVPGQDGESVDSSHDEDEDMGIEEEGVEVNPLSSDVAVMIEQEEGEEQSGMEEEGEADEVDNSMDS